MMYMACMQMTLGMMYVMHMISEHRASAYEDRYKRISQARSPKEYPRGGGQGSVPYGNTLGVGRKGRCEARFLRRILSW